MTTEVAMLLKQVATGGTLQQAGRTVVSSNKVRRTTGDDLPKRQVCQKSKRWTVVKS